MKDKVKTKDQLVAELVEMRQRLAEVEASETERIRSEEERAQAEESAEHLTAVLRAIRNVNQLIVRERDRDRLLQGVCDNFIETRGYHNAWIALLDEKGELVNTAEAGLGEGFLPLVERLKRGELTACGQRALEQPGVVAIQDPLSACTDCPLSAQYAGRGAMTIRLEHRGKVYGLLSVSIPAHLAADEEDLGLFKEVAGDVALALHSMELEEERKRAEEALRESEERYRTVVEYQTDLICRFLPDGTLTFVNQAYCRHHGQQREDLIGHSFMPLVLPEERERVAQHLASFSREKPVATIEHRAVAAGGKVRWQQWINRPIFDEQGNVTEFQAVGRDVTERKKMEEAIKESEERYRGLSKAAFEAIFISEKGVCLEQNSTAEKMFGYTLSEAIGRKGTEWIAPKDREMVMNNMLSGYEEPYEATALRKDGSTFPAEIQGKMMHYKGRTVRVTALSDITERKRAEEALRESERRYRLLAENITDLIWTMDMNLRYTYLSPSVTRASGYSVEEAMALTLEDVLTPASLKTAMKVLAEEMIVEEAEQKDLSRSLTIDLEQYRKDGSTGWTETTVTGLRDSGGRLVEILGVSRDITERKWAEEALRESEEKYRTIYDNAQVGLYRTMFSDGKVLIANKRMAELWGYESTEDCIAHCVASEHYADPGTREKLLDIMREHGKFTNFEARITKQDGTIIWLQYSGTLSPEKGYFEGVATDITERKRAEETLRESEERFRDLAELLPEIVFEADLEGNLTFVNRAAFKAFGYSQGDYDAGLNALAMIFSEDRARAVENMRRVLNGEDLGGTEYTAVRKDGSIFPIIVYSNPIVREGRTMGMRGIIVDITERVRAEDALRESEERYRNIFYTAAVPIWEEDFTTVKAAIDSLTAQGVTDFPKYMDEHPEFVRQAAQQVNILDVNEATLNLFGAASKEELIGALDKIFVPETFQIFKDEIVAIAEGQTYFEGETINQTLQGERLNVLVKMTIPSKEKEFGSVLLSTVDVTARVQAEKERERLLAQIQERRSYLESVLACAPDAIVTLNAQHGILEWNRGAEMLFGYTLQEAAGRNIDDLITGPDANVLEEAAYLTRLVLAGESVPPAEMVRYRKDGSPVEVISSGSPILVEDKVIGIVAVYTDITERKRMEQQLRQQEQLAAVGRLAAGIAHDFNNLLTTIMLYSQMSLRKPDLPPKIVHSFETILDESRQAAELIQQILDFSRHAMLKVQPLDLGSFVGKVVDILQRTIPENIRLVLEAGPEDYIIEADPTRIQQALMNLATNGRDAMPEGGELRFELSRTRLKPGDEPPVAGMSPPQTGGTEGGEWVCLAVSDTGTGMTEKVRSHIFEPFFTTKEVGKGTGLGLAQVYGIIRQHKGYIGVETEIGKGTTFRIYLPASELEEKAAEKAVAAPPRGQGETILLVEDNENLLKVGQTILESLGYRMLAAANGREALAVYEAEGGVDLVITDLVMPEMGGRQLMQKLKQVNPGLKVLAITGYALQKASQELEETGFLDIVHKPFNASALAHIVRHALDAD